MKSLYGLAAAVAAALTFAAFVADVAKAEMVNIYGPVYMVKTKHHGHDKGTKLTFTAPVAGPGVIIVKNGGDSGPKYRVKSAEITLNDRDVARERDFNAKVDVLQYNVELLASNELEVDIESCKECELAITVMGEAPVVAPAPRPLATAPVTTTATTAPAATAPTATNTTSATAPAPTTTVVTRPLVTAPVTTTATTATTATAPTPTTTNTTTATAPAATTTVVTRPLATATVTTTATTAPAATAPTPMTTNTTTATAPAATTTVVTRPLATATVTATVTPVP